jgi:hypothetical protein
MMSTQSDPEDAEALLSTNMSLGVPDIHITVKKRPRYSVELDGTTYYCQNVDHVVTVLGESGRIISTGDVYKSIIMTPRYKYRLRERLNGAVVSKIPRT